MNAMAIRSQPNGNATSPEPCIAQDSRGIQALERSSVRAFERSNVGTFKRWNVQACERAGSA